MGKTITKKKTKKLYDKELMLIRLFANTYNPFYWIYDSMKVYFDFLNKYETSINQDLVQCIDETNYDIKLGSIVMKYDEFPEFGYKLQEYIILYYITGVKFIDVLYGERVIESSSIRIPEECCYEITVDLSSLFA